MSGHSLICRLGVGDTVKVKSKPGSRRTEINFVAANKRLDFGLGNALDQLAVSGFCPSEHAADLLLLSGLLTAADTRINRDAESQDQWTREIDLYLPVSDPHTWVSLEPALRKTLNFLTGDMWQLHFRARPHAFVRLVPIPKTLRIHEPPCVCLLSGGLDSFVGAIDLLMENEYPLFVSHYWDGITSIHQSYCLDRLKAQFKVTELISLRAGIGFPTGSIAKGCTENTLRGRSFLFFALAALAASGLGRKTVIHVPENGFISLNVPLDPLRLGALSTRTTHPFYMARWNEILSGLAIDATLENRYRFKTKGGMIGDCKDQAFLRKYAKNTMSCSSPAKARWSGASPQHCGHCVPCLIRRAAMQAGLGSDATPYTLTDVEMRSRPLNSEKAEGEHIRSFQRAIARLKARPGLARILIHQPGPLNDYPNDLSAYESVYRAGLAEVEQILNGVISKPL